jgi:uncharacterized membrane protein YecN with MAPEG domain
VGSKTFDGVRFSAWVDDHDPPHVHGFYAGIAVVLDIDLKAKAVRLSRRKNNVSPANAKRSEIQRVRRAAERNVDELVQLWKVARG